MKNCTSCGAQLDDNAVYCGLCGTKQSASIPPPSYQTPPQPSFTPSVAPAQGALSARSILYQHCTSRLFLAAVILFTISVVTSVLHLFIVFNPAFFAMLNEMSGLSANEAIIFNSTIASMKGIFYFIFILLCMPTVLYCIGLWLFTANCRKKGTSTLGLTIIHKVTVALVVLWALSIAAILLLIGILFIASFRLATYANTAGMLIFIFILCAAILILPLIFNIVVVKSVSKIRLTVKNDASHTISSFIPVMMIISGVFQVITFFSDFTIIELMFTVVSVATRIIFALCISNYNRDIQIITMRTNIAAKQPPSNGL